VVHFFRLLQLSQRQCLQTFVGSSSKITVPFDRKVDSVPSGHFLQSVQPFGNDSSWRAASDTTAIKHFETGEAVLNQVFDQVITQPHEAL
jgi:hypothetical protein